MATFSGTTTYPDTIAVDKIVGITSTTSVEVPATLTSATDALALPAAVTATTFTGVNVPTVQTLAAAGTITLTKGGLVVINIAGTNAIVFPAPTTVGARYTIMNLTAATGTNSITVSAGTFLDRETGSGSVIQMALANQVVEFQVAAPNKYVVITNTGTVTFA
jgi:hypothetical protein